MSLAAIFMTSCNFLSEMKAVDRGGRRSNQTAISRVFVRVIWSFIL